MGMKSPASRQGHQGVGASYIPKTVTLNGKSSTSGKQKKNKLGALVETQVLVDSLNRETKSWACVGKDDAKRAHRAYRSL